MDATKEQRQILIWEQQRLREKVEKTQKLLDYFEERQDKINSAYLNTGKQTQKEKDELHHLLMQKDKGFLEIEFSKLLIERVEKKLIDNTFINH